jgi:hypothetical protein
MINSAKEASDIEKALRTAVGEALEKAAHIAFDHCDCVNARGFHNNFDPKCSAVKEILKLKEEWTK